MAVGDLSFAFNPQVGETPQTVAAKRALALAIMGNTSHAPRDIGEGLNSIGQALMYRKLMGGVNSSEASGMSGADKIVQGLFGGNSQFPAAPAAPADSASPPSVAPQKAADNANAPSSMDFASAQAAPAGKGDIADGIRSTASALGIDPLDLGTAISYETAGTFDPMKKGPTTQWGQHRGLIQFGEPQAKQDGVDWSNPVGSQLGPNGAVANYLRNAGVKPGMGLLDIYSAINAGAPGRYNASDANNGGAPGTVRDKVEQQMAEHRANALALLGGGDQAPAAGAANAMASGLLPPAAPIPAPNPMQADAGAAPVQVASLDPSSGMLPNAAPPAPQAGPQPPMPLPGASMPPMAAAPPAGPAGVDPAILAAAAQNGGGSPQLPASAPIPTPQPASQPQPGEIGGPEATTPAGQRVLAAMMGGQSMTGAAPMGLQPGQDATPNAQQKIAQAMAPAGPDLSTVPVMAGGTSDAVAPGSQQGGMTPQQLIQAAGNPWVMQRYGPIIDAMISQQMTPHKLELVDLGNGVKAQMDTITGRIVGQIKGQPDLKSIKDAAGNEYLFNPADPTHPITADSLVGGQATPQAQNGQPDPYASPFPRTIARTDVMKDYEGYLAQSKALNQPPMSFNDYQMNLKKEGAQSVVFNQENAANKAVGEAVGNNMADYINGAKDARSKLQALQLIKGVLDQNGDNISTGPGAQTMLSIKQGLANVFPSMADAATPTEMLQKLSTQLATADAKGLASRPTQFDFATYLKNNPGIQMSVAGQKALVDLKLQQAQHDYELGSMATHKQYANDPSGWADVVAKYDQEHPLINPITNKPADPNAVEFPAANGQGATAPQGASPKVGTVDGGYRFKGGDPADQKNWEPVN